MAPQMALPLVLSGLSYNPWPCPVSSVESPLMSFGGNSLIVGIRKANELEGA